MKRIYTFIISVKNGATLISFGNDIYEILRIIEHNPDFILMFLVLAHLISIKICMYLYNNYQICFQFFIFNRKNINVIWITYIMSCCFCLFSFTYKIVHNVQLSDLVVYAILYTYVLYSDLKEVLEIIKKIKEANK